MIDLSQLPAPNVIEALDFEALFAQRKARLLELTALADRPALAATLELESEPIVKLLQENAYRELVLRQRINEAAQAVMLAFAKGDDLPHLSSLYGVERLEVDPGAPDADIPIAPTYEDDDSLRLRTQMAPEGMSTAGPRGAYAFHARSADGRVADAFADNPVDGQVRVTVLVRADATTDGVVGKVDAALSADAVRPLNDTVVVALAEVIDYRIEAELEMDYGPSGATALAAANAALDQFCDETYQLGGRVGVDGLYAALKQPGVRRVRLIAPAQDIETTRQQAPRCIGRALTTKVSP